MTLIDELSVMLLVCFVVTNIIISFQIVLLIALKKPSLKYMIIIGIMCVCYMLYPIFLEFYLNFLGIKLDDVIVVLTIAVLYANFVMGGLTYILYVVYPIFTWISLIMYTCINIILCKWVIIYTL